MKVKVAFLFSYFSFDDRLVFDELAEEAKQGEELDPLLPSYQDLSKMLRDSYTKQIPNIYSPNNSLIAVAVYGRNINDYTKQLETLLETLMLDRLIDHDTFMESRKEVFLRAHFFVDGRFTEHDKAIRDFRETAIRLLDGYELRRRNLELGLNTFQNLVTTQTVLKDIEGFFNEIFNGDDKRNPDVSGARTDQYRT